MASSLFLVRVFSLLFTLGIGTSVATLMMYKMLANILAPVTQLLYANQTENKNSDHEEILTGKSRRSKQAMAGGFEACLSQTVGTSKSLFSSPPAKTCPDFIIHRVQLPFLLHSTPLRVDEGETRHVTSPELHCSRRELSFTSNSDWSIIDDCCDESERSESLFAEVFDCTPATNTHFIETELDDIRKEIAKICAKVQALRHNGTGSPALCTSTPRRQRTHSGSSLNNADSYSECRTPDNYIWDYRTDLLTSASEGFVYLDSARHLDINDSCKIELSFDSDLNESIHWQLSFDYRSRCVFPEMLTSDLYIDDDFPEL